MISPAKLARCGSLRPFVRSRLNISKRVIFKVDLDAAIEGWEVLTTVLEM